MTVLKSSAWRSKFRVHPFADLFPMMSDAELAETGEDITVNMLKLPIDARRHGDGWEVIDGRNRLEAMEHAGIDIDPFFHFNEVKLNDTEVLAHVISANMRRRHLTPGQVADLAVKIAKLEIETGPRDPVSRGGRGKKSKLKAKAIEVSKAMPEEVRPSERTIKRAIAKAEGRKPEKTKQEKAGFIDRLSKSVWGPPLPREPDDLKTCTDPVEMARNHYLAKVEERGDGIEAEIEIVTDALREIESKGNGAGKKPALVTAIKGRITP
jgi:hypothetical protein